MSIDIRQFVFNIVNDVLYNIYVNNHNEKIALSVFYNTIKPIMLQDQDFPWDQLPESPPTFTNTNASFTFQSLQQHIKQYTVTHYHDTRDAVPQQCIIALINLAFWGTFKLQQSTRSDPIQLITLRSWDTGELSIDLGGCWLSEHSPNDGTPTALGSPYIVGPTSSGWYIDGNYHFRLGQLGRWITHTPTSASLKWLTQTSRRQLKAVSTQTIRAHDQLTVTWPYPISQDPQGPNAIIQNNQCVSLHTIMPFEYIELQLESYPTPEPGAKRKTRINTHV